MSRYNFSFDSTNSILTINEFVLHDITASLNNGRVYDNGLENYPEILNNSITYQNFYNISAFIVFKDQAIAVFAGRLVYIENYNPDDTGDMELLEIKQIKIIPEYEKDFKPSLIIKWEDRLNNVIIPKLKEYDVFIQSIEQIFSDVDCDLHDDAEYTC